MNVSCHVAEACPAISPASKADCLSPCHRPEGSATFSMTSHMVRWSDAHRRLEFFILSQLHNAISVELTFPSSKSEYALLFSSDKDWAKEGSRDPPARILPTS